MSEREQHKACNLTPRYSTVDGVGFYCKCGRSVLYTRAEILEFTPYTLEEIMYYLFHKDWEWLKPCDYDGCEYKK